jgi:hypothetical protein
LVSRAVTSKTRGFIFMNYQKIHDIIIARARSENRQKSRGVYYEAHHIIPKCMGGTGKVHQWRHHPNIILLTIKEHRIIHACLHLINPQHSGLALAYVKMFYGNKYQGRLNSVSSSVYTQARIRAYDTISQKRLGKTYEDIMGKEKAAQRRQNQSKVMTGRKHTEESLKRMKKPKPADFGSKISAAMRGRKFKESTLEKMRKRCRPLLQLSLEGEILREWSSSICVSRELGISQGNLPRACREGRILGGFRWKYK